MTRTGLDCNASIFCKMGSNQFWRVAFLFSCRYNCGYIFLYSMEYKVWKFCIKIKSKFIKTAIPLCIIRLFISCTNASTAKRVKNASIIHGCCPNAHYLALSLNIGLIPSVLSFMSTFSRNISSILVLLSPPCTIVL